MKPILRSLLVVSLVSLVAGCRSPRPPGPTVSGKRDVSGFTTIELENAIAADIAIGPAFTLVVKGEANAVAAVRTEVHGESLVVKREGREDGQVRVAIQLPALKGIELSGASDANVAGLTGAGMRLGASGASHLAVKAATGEHLAIDASGASTVDVAGAVDDLVVDVSGASQVNARGLTVRKAVVDVSGASGLQLNGKDISGDATGASHVQVWGPPSRLAIEASGASSVDSMP
jgi:hypothetical protein